MARKWARERFQDKTFENKHTGRRIKVTGSGIDHTVYKARDRQAFYFLAVLSEMIEKAKLKSSKPPKITEDGEPSEEDLIAFEIYAIKARFRGKLYNVEVNVKLKRGSENGAREINSVGVHRNYYLHEIYEK